MEKEGKGKEEKEEKVKQGWKEVEGEPCSESRGGTQSCGIYPEPTLLHCWGLQWQETAGPCLCGTSDNQCSQPLGHSVESERQAGWREVFGKPRVVFWEPVSQLDRPLSLHSHSAFPDQVQIPWLWRRFHVSHEDIVWQSLSHQGGGSLEFLRFKCLILMIPAC